jgi:hypothetical protein
MNLNHPARSLVTTDHTILAHINFKEEIFYARASQVFITEKYLTHNQQCLNNICGKLGYVLNLKTHAG